MSLFSAGVQGYAEAMLTFIKAIGYAIWNPGAAAGAFLAAGKQFALSSALFAAGAGMGAAGGAFTRPAGSGGGAGRSSRSPGEGAMGGGGGGPISVTVNVGDNSLTGLDPAALGEAIVGAIRGAANRSRVGTDTTVGGRRALVLD